MGSGPADFIPIDLTNLPSAKTKTLRKEVKDALKDVKKLSDEGKQATAEFEKAKKRYQEAQRALTQYQTKVDNSRERVRNFIASRNQRGRFVDAVDDGLGALAKLRAAKHVAKKAYDAFKEDGVEAGAASLAEDVGWSAMAHGVRSGNPYVIAAGAVTYASGKAWNFRENRRKAQDAAVEGLKSNTKELAAAGIGNGLNSQTLRRQVRDTVLNEENGFRNTRWIGRNPGSERAYDTLTNKTGPLDPELEKKIDAKFNELLAKVQSAKTEGYKALDLGDLSGASKKFKEANEAIKGAMPMWMDPAALYTQREAGREAAKMWARSNMRMASNRTGD